MQEFITAKQEEIAELCRKHHVLRLAVFGSAARDDFDFEKSDIDLVVEFDEMPIEAYAANKAALREQLTMSLRYPVDLLTWKSIRNPTILREVRSTHEALYAA